MSAVTAVPLRPLARGSVLKLWIGLALLVLAAVGLGWWGTSGLQVVTLESGARLRVIQEGSGPLFTERDGIALHLRVHVNSLDAPVVGDTANDDDGPEPVVVTLSQMPQGLRSVATHFRANGRYLLTIPVPAYLGGPIPPGAPFAARDSLVLEIQTLQLQAGQAMALETRRLQQMMQAQQQQQAMEQIRQQGAGAPAAPPPAAPGNQAVPSPAP
jgi:FKBP-type peptidyl-prolyl cis-trans isomerase FkpA